MQKWLASTRTRTSRELSFQRKKMVAFHIRSTSLPSTAHPLVASVEEQLHRVRDSQATSRSYSVSQKLGKLKELYERVTDFLQLPLTHQALSDGQHSELVKNMLDASVRILDLCRTTIDVFSQMKGCVQQLQSSLRRRSGADGLAREVEAYMATRKVLKKVICKCLRNLKSAEKKHSSALRSKLLNLDAINILREVEEISLMVLESSLSFISQSKKPSGWTIISKLVHSKRVSCTEVDACEIQKLDSALLVLQSSKDIDTVQIQKLWMELEALESTIQETEEELECVFRRLLKTRVSLLNILNH